MPTEDRVQFRSAMNKTSDAISSPGRPTEHFSLGFV
jgi:hypothetical protein